MPEESYAWLPREELLRFDEIARVARIFAGLGASRVRLTGGEPLLRRELPTLCAMLADIEEVDEVSLTSNGLLLPEQATDLKRAGLARVTVSLDTLDAARFAELTRMAELHRVIAGIDAARAAGLDLKLDTVVLRGKNDDELCSLLHFARERGAELRFIEYMDVGGATRWSAREVVSRAEMLAVIEREWGPPTPEPRRGASPAERFVLPDGTSFGIIASVTAPFCAACDRSRVTADGRWYQCLYASSGIDLKRHLRAGTSDEQLATFIGHAWQRRNDRGAEERARVADRTPLVPVSALRRDPHLEMHTRGG
jgi:cyclic pyranopterin phosphate synthase